MAYAVSFLTDEDFDQPIMSGLLLRHPSLDVVRVIDRLGIGASDPDVLTLAANESRLLLTHDISTMQRFAAERITHCLPMAGLLEVPRGLTRKQVIDDLELIATCSLPGEYENRILFLPLV